MASFATEGEGAADLFHRPDFWKPSRLLDSPAPLAKDFFDLVIKDASLGTKPTATSGEEYFKPPPDFDDIAPLQNPSAELSHSHSDVSMVDAVPEAERDPWLFHDETTAKLPGLKTWDGFELSEVDAPLASFITEAGAFASDAFLASESNPCGISSHASYKTLDSCGWSACLLALALGRESVMFSWDQEKKAFMPALELVKTPGYSGEALSGVLRLCASCGEASRRLRAFVDRSYSTNATPSRVALANALDRLLLVVQDELGARGLRTRSILQLQSLVRPVFGLQFYFFKLVCKIKKSTTDAALLSMIYNEAQSAELSEPLLKSTMCEILSMVSKPFTDFVEEWIGLRPEVGVPISKNGPGKSFVRVDDSMWIDDQGFELSEPDYFLDLDNMPTFIPDDISQAIFETGRNLRFLQSNHPQHPLSSLYDTTVTTVPRLEWQYDWESITRVEQKALAFHHEVSETLRKSQVAPKDQHRERGDEVGDGPILQYFGKDQFQLEETVLASIAHLDQPGLVSQPWDKLSKILREQLFRSGDEKDAAGTEFTPHWSLLPLLSFGPLVYAQSRLVNRECLRLLFSEHDLRQHLRLQKAFQLLGNGIFSSRLSNALFNPDMDTTERQAGVTRSGSHMGLRLASRDNWPPASSELRLALAGVLSESFEQTSRVDKRISVVSARSESGVLPGDLSFAIRDLSAEEMEKCMNTDALEALDFLRMSYKPPSPLLPIMTPTVLIKYDRIFRVLLRVLRMLFVADQLFRDISSGSSRWQEPDDASLRFRIEAHHFVSNVARYFFDAGIEKPWRGFEDWLDRVEKGLKYSNDSYRSSSSVSPDRLGEQHERTLDDIMTALLLRKRQQPVLHLLDEIFTLILRFAKNARLRAEGAQGSDQDMKELYKLFRDKVEVFITVCRGMSEKSGYAQRRDGGKMEENPIVMLLILLDMTNYYVRR